MTALGTQTVSLKSLNREQNIELLTAVLEGVKPCLPDMAKMRRLDGEIYATVRISWAEMVQAQTEIHLPSNITAATRCMHLLTYSRSGPGESYLDIRALLLLSNASLLIVNFRAVPTVDGMHPESLTITAAEPGLIKAAEPGLLKAALTTQNLEVLLLTLSDRMEEHLRTVEKRCHEAQSASGFMRSLAKRLNLNLRIG